MFAVSHRQLNPLAMLLLWIGSAWSAEAESVCTFIDMSSLPIEEQSDAKLEAWSYQLSYKADSTSDLKPTVKDATICVDNPTYDVPTVFSKDALETVRTTNKAEYEKDVAISESFTTELTTNTYCDVAALADLDTAIDTLVTSWQTQLDSTVLLSDLKTHLRDQFYTALGEILKKGFRCLEARGELQR